MRKSESDSTIKSRKQTTHYKNPIGPDPRLRLRPLRTPQSPNNRFFPSRLRANDGFNLNPILPYPTIAGYMQRHRRIAHIPAGQRRDPGLVRQEARRCLRHHDERV